MSKLRKGFRVLEGGAGLQINGVGGMEVAEVRGFVGGVVDGLRLVFWHQFCPGIYYVLFVLTMDGVLGKSAGQEKRLGESGRRRSRRMDSVVVTTKMMMTICNYNVHFPFFLSSLLIFFSLWLQYDASMLESDSSTAIPTDNSRAVG